MKKLIIGLFLFILSTSGIFSQSLNFEYSNALVGRETVFINRSSITGQVITVAWDLNGNGVYNDGWGDTVRYVYQTPGLHEVGLRITIVSLESFVLRKNIEISHYLNVDFEFNKVCVGNVTQITNTSESTDPIISAQWDLDHDGLFDDASGNSINYMFATAGVHNVGLRIVTQSGLAKAIYRQIIVANFPVADFSTSNACAGSFTEFINLSTTSADDVSNFTWKFGDGSAWSNVSNPIHTYSSPGIYNVTLIAESSFGCSDTIVRNVSIKPVPEFSLMFSGDTVFTEGESVTVTAIGDFDQAVWWNGTVANSIMITERGNYSVEVSKSGCLNSKTFTITVNDRVGITNLFTPNGDGYNDRWEIFHVEKLRPCTVSIYNRSGVEVYSNSDYINDWGGTYNGQPLPEGTYYYILKCNDNKITKGAITIIR